MQNYAPEHNPDGNRHVERVFRAVLRDFQAQVRRVDDLLFHAAHLVAEDQRVALVRIGTEILQRRRPFRLLHAHDGVTFRPQGRHGFQGRSVMGPVHAELGTQGRLMDFRRRRRGGDAAQAELFDPEGVAGAEGRADVVLAAHVVEHQGKGRFAGLLVLLHGDPPQFAVF